jgi:ribonuclease D
MDFVWIDSPEALTEFVQKIDPRYPLPLDTEADSLYHYKESLCLIQISQNGNHALIDPMGGLDLSPLWQIITPCDWVIHSLDYDLRLLRGMGCAAPNSVFDTMIAAQDLGVKGMSYAALVERFLGIQLQKGSQTKDWSQRPLPKIMLDYAVRDTAHLEELRAHLVHELHVAGRAEWHEESCARAVRQTAIPRVIDPDEVWRVTGANKLQPPTLAILKELWLWREEEAKAKDVPVFKFLMNENLLKLAIWAGSNPEETTPPRGVSTQQVYGPRLERFQEALARGRAAEPIARVGFGPRPKYAPDFPAKVDKIKAHRDKVATELGIDPTLLATKTTLFTLAADPASAGQKLLEEDKWCRWQWDLIQPGLAELG